MENVAIKSKNSLLENIKTRCYDSNINVDILDSEWEAFTSCIYEIMKLRNKDSNYSNALEDIIRSSLINLYALRRDKTSFNLEYLFKSLSILEIYGINKKDIELIIEYIKELTSWGEVLEIKNFIKRK